MQVCDVSGTIAKKLENVVMTVLEENGLNVENIRGQGYDGAANMSGSCNGLQSRIKTHNKKALYMHCHAHCLNPVLVECAKSSQHVMFFFISLKIYVLISSRVCTLQTMDPNQRVCELKRLSDTRWVCREEALRSLKNVLSAGQELLQNMADRDPPDCSR